MTRDTARTGSGKRVQSTRALFTIVDALRDHGPAGAADLAGELEMPKSTVHVHLKTLEEEGYLLNDGGEYRLGFRFLELGGETRHCLEAYRAARSEVDDLSAETGEAAHFGLEERGMRVLLYSSTAEGGVYDNSPDGHYTHLHWTAMGKALLADLPDERVHAVVDEHGLPGATEHTVTDRDRLFAELETVRQQGYATEHGEHRRGLATVAAALAEAPDDRGPAAIGVSGPRHRIERKNADGDLAEAVRNAVNVVNLELRYY